MSFTPAPKVPIGEPIDLKFTPFVLVVGEGLFVFVVSVLD